MAEFPKRTQTLREKLAVRRKLVDARMPQLKAQAASTAASPATESSLNQRAERVLPDTIKHEDEPLSSRDSRTFSVSLGLESWISAHSDPSPPGALANKRKGNDPPPLIPVTRNRNIATQSRGAPRSLASEIVGQNSPRPSNFVIAQLNNGGTGVQVPGRVRENPLEVVRTKHGSADSSVHVKMNQESPEPQHNTIANNQDQLQTRSRGASAEVLVTGDRLSPRQPHQAAQSKTLNEQDSTAAQNRSINSSPLPKCRSTRVQNSPLKPTIVPIAVALKKSNLPEPEVPAIRKITLAPLMDCQKTRGQASQSIPSCSPVPAIRDSHVTVQDRSTGTPDSPKIRRTDIPGQVRPGLHSQRSSTAPQKRTGPDVLRDGNLDGTSSAPSMRQSTVIINDSAASRDIQMPDTSTIKNTSINSVFPASQHSAFKGRVPVPRDSIPEDPGIRNDLKSQAPAESLGPPAHQCTILSDDRRTRHIGRNYAPVASISPPPPQEGNIADDGRIHKDSTNQEQRAQEKPLIKPGPVTPTERIVRLPGSPRTRFQKLVGLLSTSHTPVDSETLNLSEPPVQKNVSAQDQDLRLAGHASQGGLKNATVTMEGVETESEIDFPSGDCQNEHPFDNLSREALLSLVKQNSRTLDSWVTSTTRLQNRYAELRESAQDFKTQIKEIEKDKLKAQTKQEKAAANKIRAENEELKRKLHQSFNSGLPECSQMAEMWKKTQELQESLVKMEAILESSKKETEFVRGQYNDSANAMYEMRRELVEMQSSRGDLEKKADDRIVKLHELRLRNESAARDEKIEELEIRLRERTDRIMKLENEKTNILEEGSLGLEVDEPSKLRNRCTSQDEQSQG